MSHPQDPEDTTTPRPDDLREVAVDEIDEQERELPLEAEPADVAEQRADVAGPLGEDEDALDEPDDAGDPTGR